MKTLLFTALVCFLSLSAFAQEPQGVTLEDYFKEFDADIYERIQKQLDAEKKKSSEEINPQTGPKLVTELGAVYVGMPKEDLEEVGFTKELQETYQKDENEELISFSNPSNPESDPVVFYILDGRVKGWKE